MGARQLAVKALPEASGGQIDRAEDIALNPLGIYRVTARKDQYGEVHDFICNTCRYDKKSTNDWTIEGPRAIDRHSVISQNHYDDEATTVR